MRAIMVSIFLAMSTVMFGSMSGRFMAVGQDTGVSSAADPAMLSETAQYTKAFASIAEKFGLWAALTVLLIIATLVMGWLREKRMAKRIDVLEDSRAESTAEIATALSRNGELLESMVGIQNQQLQEWQKLTTELRVTIALKARGE